MTRDLERLMNVVRQVEFHPEPLGPVYTPYPTSEPFQAMVRVLDGTPTASGHYYGTLTEHNSLSGIDNGFTDRTDVPLWIRTPQYTTLQSGLVYWGRAQSYIRDTSGYPLYLVVPEGGTGTFLVASGTLSGTIIIGPGTVTIVSGTTTSLNSGVLLNLYGTYNSYGSGGYYGNYTYYSGSQTTYNSGSTVTYTPGTVVSDDSTKTYTPQYNEVYSSGSQTTYASGSLTTSFNNPSFYGGPTFYGSGTYSSGANTTYQNGTTLVFRSGSTVTYQSGSAIIYTPGTIITNGAQETFTKSYSGTYQSGSSLSLGSGSIFSLYGVYNFYGSGNIYGNTTYYSGVQNTYLSGSTNSYFNLNTFASGRLVLPTKTASGQPGYAGFTGEVIKTSGWTYVYNGSAWEVYQQGAGGGGGVSEGGGNAIQVDDGAGGFYGTSGQTLDADLGLMTLNDFNNSRVVTINNPFGAGLQIDVNGTAVVAFADTPDALRTVGDTELCKGSGSFGIFNKSPSPQRSGAAATAGASYTSTEQTMLQVSYDAMRAFGFISG